MLKRYGPWRAIAAATAGMALWGGAAQAAVTNVDFEGFTPDVYFDGATLVDNGFDVTVHSDFAVIDTAAGCFGGGMVCPSGNESQFYMALNDGRVSLSRSDGQAFQLLGFDAGFIAPAPLPGLDVGLVQLHATTVDGSVVNKAFEFGLGATDGSFAFNSYAPAGLGWLRSVEFSACTWADDGSCSNPNANLGQFGLDNVALSPVPEPTTVALMAAGLFGLVLRRRGDAV